MHFPEELSEGGTITEETAEPSGRLSEARDPCPPFDGHAEPFTDRATSTPAMPQSAGRLLPFWSKHAGTIASAVLHLWLVSMLASLTWDEYVPLETTPIDATLPDDVSLKEPELLQKLELANPRDRETELSQVVAASSAGLVKSAASRIVPSPVSVFDEFSNMAAPSTYDIHAGGRIDERLDLKLKGQTGVSTTEIESALDRVTWEIANQLLERKVLVTWLLDSSGSLKKQRAIVARRMERIYGELGTLDQTGQIVARQEEALLSGVVAFGERTVFMTPEPTADFRHIVAAFTEAPYDESGRENVFSAIDQVVHRWSKYRTEHGRSLMVVVVTDETGDDFDNLEQAIRTCRRYGAKTYVIGPAAVFGRRKGFVPYVAPENKKTYQLPVDLGPESFVLEMVSLPFWFGGRQLDYLSAGMGPYGLSRIVRETGGVYFLTNMTTSSGFATNGVFEPDLMKAFEPDYSFGTPQEYIDDISRHPLRRAVMMAGELSEKYKAKGVPELDIKVTTADYQRVLGDAQKSAAETIYALDQILSAFSGNLEVEFQREKSPRWRANYCLTLGRLLALKARAYDYNLAAAQLKQLGTGDIANKANHFIFRPSEQFASGAATRKMAGEAGRLLRRVIEDAPGTPWALLARRELAAPMGFEVVQKFDPPPKPRAKKNNPAPTKPGKKRVLLANDNPQKKPAAPAKPPPEPKLPKL